MSLMERLAGHFRCSCSARLIVGTVAAAALVLLPGCAEEYALVAGQDVPADAFDGPTDEATVDVLDVDDAGELPAEDVAADVAADVVEDFAEDVAAEDFAEDASDTTDVPASGFIGSPCRTASDCAYAGAVCLTEAPGGMCSLECDRYCEDRAGFPMTFCVDLAALPDEAMGFVEGACFSRCDYGLFPGSGCRDGYGCALSPRANELTREEYTCIPGADGPLPTDCRDRLTALGVTFWPAAFTPEHPSGYPSLTCTIEDPVTVRPPIHGIELVSYSSGESRDILAACDMALALVATVDDLAAHGVTRIWHWGTYNCRVVDGTDRLSRHAYGDAIDLVAFDLSGGASYSLEDDWEHDTTSPRTPGGLFLYEAAHRWYDHYVWNTILTPNYNLAHDDHFHVDLKPDAHFLELVPDSWFSEPWFAESWSAGRYLGPAPYDD